MCLAMEAGRWLCLKPKLLVVFCPGMVRFVILGPQTFCMELGVTALSCLLKNQSGGSSGNTTVRVIDFVRT